MIHPLPHVRLTGFPHPVLIRIALGCCLVIPVVAPATHASAGPIELWGTFMGHTAQIDNGQNMWNNFSGQGNVPRLDALFGGSEGVFDLSLTFIPEPDQGINGSHVLPLEFFLKDGGNQNVLWSTRFTLGIVDGLFVDEVRVDTFSVTHAIAPHPEDNELPNSLLGMRNLVVSGTQPGGNAGAPPGVVKDVTLNNIVHANGGHMDICEATLVAWKQPVEPFPNWNSQFKDWSFQVQAWHTPEIDPSGLASVMAIVCGSGGLMERRLRRAAAPWGSARQ